jgi:hypothetical protein
VTVTAKKVAAVAVLLPALGLGAGIAYASVPGPDGVVHGCYQSSGLGDGALYVIDSGASCPTGYTALNWDQTAPAGLAGYEVVSQTFNYTAGQQSAQPGISCPSGKKALGGGVNSYDLLGSWPQSNGSGWNVSIKGPNDGNPWSATIYVTCASAV